MLIPSVSISPNYQILRPLGQGGEGLVYLVKDRSTGDKLVLKDFYEPIRGSSGQGLRLYEEKVASNELGLPRIMLLENSGQINGVFYPFVPLCDVDWRILRIFEPVAQALFGAYCRMQAYLMSQCKIGLTDTVAHHFMLAGNGQFHFIDYGFSIKSVEHTRYLDQGRFGFGFAMLLLSVYNINLKEEILPKRGYSYSSPCVYCMSSSLDVVAAQHDWVKEIVTEVRSHNAGVFLEPDFYQRLAERLPGRVPFPMLVNWTSKFSYYVRKMRNVVRGMSIF